MFLSSFLAALSCLTILTDLAVGIPLYGPREVSHYTTVPSRPPAAYLPKGTDSIPTKTQMDTTITTKPLQKRAGMDPAMYLTSFQALVDEFSTNSAPSLSSKISSFVANNSPTGVPNAEVQSKFDSIMSSGNALGSVFTSAVGEGWKDFITAFGDDANESTSGVISTSDGTTYWSLPDYVSIWSTMNSTARESWRTSNNYVGTYVESWATSYSPGVRVAQGSETFWRSDFYMAIVASLATIDSGMAQISWMKHNIYSGGPSLITSTNSTKPGGGVTAQMFDQGQQNSGSTSSTSGQSISTSSSQGGDSSQSESGSQQSSLIGAANVVAAFRPDVAIQISTSGSGSSTESGSGTSSQQTTSTGGASGLMNTAGLFDCPIYTGEAGVYADCYAESTQTSVTGASTSSNSLSSSQTGSASA